MTPLEFDKWLEKQTYEDRIVRIKYRYDFEENWTYQNVLLTCSDRGYPDYEWGIDWYEGQSDVEIIGCLSIAEVLIPTFKEHEDLKDYAISKLATEISKIMFGGDKRI